MSDGTFCRKAVAFIPFSTRTPLHSLSSKRNRTQRFERNPQSRWLLVDPPHRQLVVLGEHGVPSTRRPSRGGGWIAGACSTGGVGRGGEGSGRPRAQADDGAAPGNRRSEAAQGSPALRRRRGLRCNMLGHHLWLDPGLADVVGRHRNWLPEQYPLRSATSRASAAFSDFRRV
jgi:hypothetical protein